MVRNPAVFSLEKGGNYAFVIMCKKHKMYPNYIKKQNQLLCGSTSWAKSGCIGVLLTIRVSSVDWNSVLGELQEHLVQTAFKNPFFGRNNTCCPVVVYSIELLTMGLQSCLLLIWISQICLLIQRWEIVRALPELLALKDLGFPLGSRLSPPVS